MNARVVAAQQFLEFVAVLQVACFNDAFHLKTVTADWAEPLTDTMVMPEQSAAYSNLLFDVFT